MTSYRSRGDTYLKFCLFCSIFTVWFHCRFKTNSCNLFTGKFVTLKCVIWLKKVILLSWGLFYHPILMILIFSFTKSKRGLCSIFPILGTTVDINFWDKKWPKKKITPSLYQCCKRGVPTERWPRKATLTGRRDAVECNFEKNILFFEKVSLVLSRIVPENSSLSH